jgi:hypothetical protein
VFRGLVGERSKIQKAVEWYEDNKDWLTFPLRKGSGVDWYVQILRAYNLYHKAIKGSAKEPALDHDAALESVSEKMTPKPGNRGNTTTTAKEREAILFLLAAQSFKDRTLVQNWKTPNVLSTWLLTVHPNIRDALLDEASAVSDSFGNEAFGKIPYPSRMAKLWGWKEGQKPDAGEDGDLSDDDEDEGQNRDVGRDAEDCQGVAGAGAS